MVEFRQKWLYSRICGFIRTKLLYSGKVVLSQQNGCVQAKVVVFMQKWFYSRKVVVFGQSDCIRSNVVVFEKKWMYSGKVAVFGQKWLYSSKSGCNQTK